MRHLRLVELTAGALCAALITLSSARAAPTFEEGVIAYQRGDYATALAVFRPLAEKGAARAQTILGLMYSYGEGVPVDFAEAAGWYRRAAEQGYGVGQYNLGMLYLQGRGVARDEAEAARWLEAAARGGHFRANAELARLDPGLHSSLPDVPASTLEAPPDTGPTAPAPAPDNAADAPSEPPRSVVLTRRDTPPASSSPKPGLPAGIVAESSNRPAPASGGVTTGSTARAPVEPAVAQAAPPSPDGVAAGPQTRAVARSDADARAAPRNGSAGPIYKVQLGASQSEDLIKREWSSFQSRYPDVFGDLDGSIERAEVGEDNAVWYRLRVGPFHTEASAKELCLEIAERGIRSGCLPLRVKR